MSEKWNECPACAEVNDWKTREKKVVVHGAKVYHEVFECNHCGGSFFSGGLRMEEGCQKIILAELGKREREIQTLEELLKVVVKINELPSYSDAGCELDELFNSEPIKPIIKKLRNEDE